MQAGHDNKIAARRLGARPALFFFFFLFFASEQEGKRRRAMNDLCQSQARLICEAPVLLLLMLSLSFLSSSSSFCGSYMWAEAHCSPPTLRVEGARRRRRRSYLCLEINRNESRRPTATLPLVCHKVSCGHTRFSLDSFARLDSILLYHLLLRGISAA